MARVAVTTFGCQMNQHDSERMLEVLVRAGSTVTPGYDGAEVVVLNTCSVRDKAEQKLRSEVGRLAQRKRANPELIIVVAGCMAQQEGERILKRMPVVDLVLGPDNIADLPALIRQVQLGGPPQVRTQFDLDAPAFLTAPSVHDGPTAFVTTMKGCNERCSFCVVPNTRGPERYRPSAEIVTEIVQLVEGGVREVTLLGQTVNSYRDPSAALPVAPGADRADPDESEFAALLRHVAASVPALLRLRYTSPHPRHLTPSLIAAHRDLAVLPRHVHLPVQSGADRVLKRMIRRYTRAEYLDRVERLRCEVPGVTLSTDIIVGFCGETEAEFEQTLSLVEEVRFTGVFAFKYSVRPRTPAARLEDDVPEAEKARRLAGLFDRTERILREHLAATCGTTQEVLVEGPSKSNPAMMTGRTGHSEIVHMPYAAGAVGRLVDVTIVEAFKHSLRGELSAAERARLGPAAPERRRLPVMARSSGDPA